MQVRVCTRGSKQRETKVHTNLTLGVTAQYTGLLTSPGHSVIVSIQWGDWEWKVDGWMEAALISRLPQVFSHGKSFLVEKSSMDPLLSHDYNQYWSTQGKKEINKIEEFFSLPDWRGEQSWQALTTTTILHCYQSFQDILTACRRNLNSNISFCLSLNFN